MNIFVQVIHIYATVLPYAFPFIVAYLIFFLIRENKERNESIKAFAHYYHIPVKTAKQILTRNFN